MRQRLFPALAAALALGLGLGARAVLGGLLAKVLGVAFYATFVYALVVLVRPSVRPGRAFLIAVALCFAVELAQLSPVPAYLSARHVLFRLALGTTFSAWDLPAYVGGAALAAAVHAIAGRRHRGAPRARPSR